MANHLIICKIFKVPCVSSAFRRAVYENCFFKVFRISGRNVEYRPLRSVPCVISGFRREVDE